MDRMIYVAMSGAKQTMEQQSAVSNNLANAVTTGFRAELATFRAVPVRGSAQPTRTYVVDSTPGANFAPGTIQQTGRALDIAINGSGWIAVQGPGGQEGYTRDGDLQISSSNVLTTRHGAQVVGQNGPIAVPPGAQVTIAADGTVSATLSGTPPSVSEIGRIKLVNPPMNSLQRGDDGLFRTRDGKSQKADAAVTLSPSALEGSNVNMTEQMVNMIALSRQYELQTRMISTAADNEKSASAIFAL